MPSQVVRAVDSQASGILTQANCSKTVADDVVPVDRLLRLFQPWLLKLTPQSARLEATSEYWACTVLVSCGPRRHRFSEFLYLQQLRQVVRLRGDVRYLM